MAEAFDPAKLSDEDLRAAVSAYVERTNAQYRAEEMMRARQDEVQRTASHHQYTLKLAELLRKHGFSLDVPPDALRLWQEVRDLVHEQDDDWGARGLTP